MNAIEPQAPKPRNPLTYQIHRRQVFWQITIPVLIGALILAALAALAVMADASQTRQLADVSLISLIVPALIFGLIFMIITIGSIYGVVRLIQVLPIYTFQAQNFLALVYLRVDRIGNSLAGPFMRMHSFRASLSAFRRSLLWIFRLK